MSDTDYTLTDAVAPFTTGTLVRPIDPGIDYDWRVLRGFVTAIWREGKYWRVAVKWTNGPAAMAKAFGCRCDAGLLTEAVHVRHGTATRRQDHE